MKFDSKVALVTGGASGIGLATAKEFKTRGATVVIADIDREGGEAAAADLGAEFVFLDVTQPAAWEDVLGGIVAKHGALHIAHLNAGLLTPTNAQASLVNAFDITQLQDADYRTVTSVNIDGVVFGTRAVARAIAKSGGVGAIVATASVAGVLPFAVDPLYTLTKHAVVGFVRAMAPLLMPKGISYNAVCPALVRTNIASPGTYDAVEGAGGRVMQPDVIARAVADAVESGDTGECFVCLPNQAPIKQVFPNFDIV